MVGNHGIEHGATGVPGFVGGNRWRHASTLRTASRIRRGQDIAATILHICAVVKKNNTGRTKQATRYAPYPRRVSHRQVLPHVGVSSSHSLPVPGTTWITSAPPLREPID